MKTNNIFIYFVVLLLVTSCKQSTTNYGDTQSLNFNHGHSADISDILEMSFIKLETNDNCLINSIRQVESALGKIFILTGGAESGVLVFDSLGKFVAPIGTRGNGPQEYLLCSSFSIDHYRNIISLVDMAQKKVINYNLINYEFVSEHRLVEGFSSFEYLGNNHIVWHNFVAKDDLAGWCFVVTDINQNYINKYVKRNFITGYHTAPLKSMYKIDSDVFVYSGYHPIIYQCLGDNIHPLYKLEFGRFQIPPLDHLKKISAGNVNFLPELARSNFVYTFIVFGTYNTVVVEYTVSNIQYIGVYNKQNNQTYSYTMEDFQKMLKIGKIDRISGIVNNSFAAVMFPFYLFEEKNNSLNPELHRLIDESNEDDNPILCLFRLKTN
ncbi:MAG: 6-bladed beta-propeller [Firmicutes bacterium]|nr:6-bladed beta-propeller [Bacillota bacterium]